MPSREKLHERGVAASARGQHARARQLLEAARAGLEPGDLLARIDGSLAYVRQETGDSDGAVALCRRALDYPGVSDTTRGTVYGVIGLLGMLRGERDGALDAFDRAIRLLDDPRLLGRAYLNRGSIYTQRELSRPAAADFRTAEGYFRQVGDAFAAAKARHNLGCVQLLEGDVVGALRNMDDAYPTFRDQGPVMAAMADTDRAEALLAAGLQGEARAALRRASQAYRGRRLYQRRGEAELALGRSLVQTDPGEALVVARRARTRFVHGGTPVWQLRAEVAIHAAEVSMGRKAPSLVTRADDLADELIAVGLRQDAQAARLNAARVAGRRGDQRAMQERLRQIRLGSASALPLRLLEHDVRADAAVLAGRRSRAVDHLRAGLAELHDWQSGFGSLDLQTNVVGHGVRLARRGLELAIESGSDAVLLEWSERARMVASRVQPVRPPSDPELGAALAELRGSPPPDRTGELRKRVRELAWRRPGSGEVADPVSVDRLCAGLGEHALVAYVVAAGRVVALIVTTDGVTRVDLGAWLQIDALMGGLLPDLDVAAGELPGPMGRAVRGDLAVRLARLAELLVAPVLDAVGDRPLVLTPSGALAGMPWQLLPGFVGRPVTVAQSATSWLARSGSPLRTQRAGFVAGPRVARAVDEVTAAANEWPGVRVLTGGDAVAQSVSSLAAGVDVLHVAAHGRHSAESPLFSGLQLADGPWFGYDIDQLAAVPDVVLLSACEVGRSTVRWGEELIGMTAAWLHAGARCVIASPASVADEAAYDVLVAVHRRMAAGASPTDALAAAVPAVTPDAPPAPFVCFG